MNTFFGTPYIDIRIDFNSWLPENLTKILKKLTNFYLKNLKRTPILTTKLKKILYLQHLILLLRKELKRIKKYFK